MCSPRPNPTPPPTMTIAERNAELNSLSLKIANADQAGNRIVSSVMTEQAKKIIAMPVDPASAVYARTGTPGQTVSPSATSLELAPSQLQGMLAKRATSTLRIPATTPATT